MPELPEVETVVRLVREPLLGRRVVASVVLWERSLGGLSKAAFGRAVRGTRFTRVWRRAKYLVFDLERDGKPAGSLVGHLRMTGRMHVEPRTAEPDPYLRVGLDLDDGNRLTFVDVRKFGRLTHVTDVKTVFDKLGPEPLGDEFTVAWLRGALRARKRMLKPLLLDQHFLAGLGNIYVDEALHTVGLHPQRRSDQVPPARVPKLHGAIRSILKTAIEREGSSFDRFYRTPEGQPGSYQHQFQVYGRHGKPCRRCGARVARIVVSQRGTHLCRRCQRAPRRTGA